MDESTINEQIKEIMGEGLTPKHWHAIATLVYSTKKKKEIAKDLGITEQTLYNWLANPTFQYQLSVQTKLRFNKINEELARPYMDYIESIYTSQREILEQGTHKEKIELLTLLMDKYDFSIMPQTQIHEGPPTDPKVISEFLKEMSEYQPKAQKTEK